MSEPQAALEVVGERVRRLREGRGISRDELARRTGLSKTTILRLERGLPTRDRALKLVAECLKYPKIYLLMPEEEWNRPYRIHRNADDAWHALSPRKRRAPGTPVDVIDPDERNRLGAMGYFELFFLPFSCLLPNSGLVAGINETYEASNGLIAHPGLEFVYMIHGTLVITIGEEDVTLHQGEVMVFWANVPHGYRPLSPVERHEVPPTSLMVVIEGIEPDSTA